MHMTMLKTRPRISWAIGAIAGSLWLTSTFASASTIDLTPRFVVGQENRYVVDMHSKSQTQFLDRSRVRLQEYQQRLRVKRKVVDANDSGATIELKYESVSVNLVAGNKLISFDSNGTNIPEAEEMMGAGVRDAMALTFTVKVDRLGKVLSISGNEKEVAKQAATNLINEDVLVRAMAPLYGLGKDPASAAVGESWTTTRVAAPSTTGVFTTTLTSTLLSAAEGRAHVTVTGAMTLALSDKAKAANAEFMSHDVRGEQIWSVEAGLVDRTAYRQVMEVQADVDGRGPLQEEAELRRREIETMQHIVITRVDDNVSTLPPLPAELAPTPVTVPDQPPSPIVPPATDGSK